MESFIFEQNGACDEEKRSFMEQRRLVKSGDKKADFIPNLTGIPIQRRLAPKTQDQTAFDNVRVQYNLNDANLQSHPAVIQRKQIVPLAERLKWFDADIGTESTDYENTNFQALLENYDAIENVIDTKPDQSRYLESMLYILKNMKGDKARRAESILEDELFFVSNQSYDSPLAQHEDPWAHMNDSPFIRSLQILATDEGVLAPPGKQLLAKELIESTSKSHLVGLKLGQLCGTSEGIHTKTSAGLLESVSNESILGYISVGGLQQWVQDCIQKEGVLAHYSHRNDIAIIHSTDYLKENNLLAKDAKVNMDASANQMTTKSQPVDIGILQNSGFVFMFLERRNANHRETRFGSYRYCVSLSSSYGRNLLEQGWAILHDLAGTPETEKNHERIYNVRRTIQKTLDNDAVNQKIKSLNLDEMEANTQKMMLMMLPAVQYSTNFTSLNEHDKYEHPLQSGASDHYFMGEDIIPGIALRIARELYMLSQFNEEAYKEAVKNKDNLWQYISKVVYDMQIMLPVSVMPEMLSVKPKT